jgi:peptidoglycan lytic transglycosylase
MRRGVTNILVMFAVVTSLAAAPQSSSPSNTSPQAASQSNSSQVKHAKTYQVGRASWYGKFFHGKPTASGEPYNMFLFTAAHNTLPLGTLLRVTNLRNGKAIVVRVNDRGPVPEGRIIDLSYAAAQVLGFRQGGLTRVRLQILETPEVAQVRTPQTPGLP